MTIRTIQEWGAEWLGLGSSVGWDNGPDIDERIDHALKLWDELATIAPAWKRESMGYPGGLDDRDVRYRRGNKDKARDPEHELEHELLVGNPVRECLGWTVADGINEIPLVNSRSGQITADVLLLGRRECEWRIFLLEVKSTSNDPWYAALEHLRQLAMFLAGGDMRRLFHQRGWDLPQPDTIPVKGLVFAPSRFYRRENGSTHSAHVEPTRRLFERLRAHDARADVKLATHGLSRHEVVEYE